MSDELLEDIALDFDVPAFIARDYQEQCIAKIFEAWLEYSRILAVLATGCGKTVIFSIVTQRVVAAGGRVLILAHTEELLDQAADKLFRATGLVAEKEKAESHASLDAKVVIASIQSVCRDNRLTGWPENHFTHVIVDESHRSLAKSYMKVLRYFHFGALSLLEGWEQPEPGVPYTPLALILGVTATADRGDRRNLGEFYQHCAFEYGLLQACRDGYLVRPISKQIPLKIDLRGVKVSRTGQGSDFDLTEVGKRITPFLQIIAQNIAIEATNRKTVCFLPGIETARLLAEALCDVGMTGMFVSGACEDRAEKLERFDRGGAGMVMCNAMLLTEGWDCPDVSCVCVLRPTKIRSLYVQCVGRGTRPLPGLIDGLGSGVERRQAIAESAKPDLLILDFLWLSDRLDLVKPSDLVATKPEVKELMKADGEGGQPVDLLSAEELASRDLLKSLEKAAAEHKNKKGRVIDPLAAAVALGDDAIADYQPANKWDELPPTPGQVELLTKHGLDSSKVTCRGVATRLLERIDNRQKMGLCSVKQLNFLTQLGVRSKDTSLLTISEATAAINSALARKRGAHGR